MAKGKLFLFFLFALLGVVFSNEARAIQVPQISVTDIKLLKTDFIPGEEIKGSVMLLGDEASAIGELKLSTQLFWGEKINRETPPTKLIDRIDTKDSFSLSPQELKSINFTYLVPTKLPKGDFVLRMYVVDKKGQLLGWNDSQITIKSDGEFLMISKGMVLKTGDDGKTINSGLADGAIFNPNDAVSGQFDVVNNYQSDILAYLKTTTYKRNIGQEVVKEEKQDAIIVKPKETKTIKVQLPSVSEPGNYVSESRFYNSKTDEPTSNFIYFNYVISGIDAKIISVKPDKSAYFAGETAKIKVDYVGPADMNVAGGQGILKIKLSDNKSNLVGEVSKEINLDSGTVSVSIPVKSKINSLQIEAIILKDNKILDNYTLKVAPTEPLRKKMDIFSFPNLIVLIISLLIVLIAFIWAFFRLKSGKKIFSLLFLVIFLGITLSFNNALASFNNVLDGGCQSGSLSWNTPTGGFYRPGDWLHFTGTSNFWRSSGQPSVSKITFYIATNSNFGTQDACRSGSTSGNCNNSCNCTDGCFSYFSDINPYLYSSTQLPADYVSSRLGSVKILNRSTGLIRELGSTIVQSNDTGIPAYYDVNLQIPTDWNFSGTVRLYAEVLDIGDAYNSRYQHYNISYNTINIASNHYICRKNSYSTDCVYTVGVGINECAGSSDDASCRPNPPVIGDISCSYAGYQRNPCVFEDNESTASMTAYITDPDGASTNDYIWYTKKRGEADSTYIVQKMGNISTLAKAYIMPIGGSAYMNNPLTTGDYTAKLYVYDSMSGTSVTKDFSITGHSHTECVTTANQNYCRTISGDGVSQCTSNEDCRTNYPVISYFQCLKDGSSINPCVAEDNENANLDASATDPDGLFDLDTANWYAKGRDEDDSKYILKKSGGFSSGAIGAYYFTTNHPYGLAIGDYTVKLVVTDKEGHSVWTTQDLSVTARSHTECVSGTSINYCRTVSGVGTNQCATDADCRANYPVVSVECKKNSYPDSLCTAEDNEIGILDGTATDPDGSYDLNTATWYVKGRNEDDSQYVSKKSGNYSGNSNYYYTSQYSSLAIGEYTAKFVVVDKEGHSSSITKDFTITGRSHKECAAIGNQNYCRTVYSEGTNLCSADADCRTVFPVPVINCLVNGSSSSSCAATTSDTIKLQNNSTDPDSNDVYMQSDINMPPAKSDWYVKIQGSDDSGYALLASYSTSPILKDYTVSNLQIGSYTIKLVVTDKEGHSAFTEKNISISGDYHNECTPSGSTTVCKQISGVGTNQCNVSSDCGAYPVPKITCSYVTAKDNACYGIWKAVGWNPILYSNTSSDPNGDIGSSPAKTEWTTWGYPQFSGNSVSKSSSTLISATLMDDVLGCSQITLAITDKLGHRSYTTRPACILNYYPAIVGNGVRCFCYDTSQGDCSNCTAIYGTSLRLSCSNIGYASDCFYFRESGAPFPVGYLPGAVLKREYYVKKKSEPDSEYKIKLTTYGDITNTSSDRERSNNTIITGTTYQPGEYTLKVIVWDLNSYYQNDTPLSLTKDFTITPAHHYACVDEGGLKVCKYIEGLSSNECATTANCRPNNPVPSITCTPSTCSVKLGYFLMLNNESTDLDGQADVSKSDWYVKPYGSADSNYGATPKYSASGLPNFIPQSFGIGIGNYTAKLVITDLEGHVRSKTKNFSIVDPNTPEHTECMTEEGINNCGTALGAGADLCTGDAYCQANSPVVSILCTPSGCKSTISSGLTLVNNSSHPDGDDNILTAPAKSDWFIRPQGLPDLPAYYVKTKSYNGKSNYIPTSDGLAVGEWVAKLRMTDKAGHMVSGYKDFEITSSSIPYHNACVTDGLVNYCRPAPVPANQCSIDTDCRDHFPLASIACDPDSCSIAEGETLNLNNASDDPDGIADITNPPAKSVWSIKSINDGDDAPFVVRKTYDGRQGYTPTADGIGKGQYIAKLEMYDMEGNYSSTTKNFFIGNAAGPLVPSISCSVTNCIAPSCDPGACEAFVGEQILTLNNLSTPTNEIVNSQWWYKSNSGNYITLPACSNTLCSYTPSISVAGSYTAKLRISGSDGSTAETTKSFILKASTKADFSCSMDNTNWQECSTIPKLYPGKKLYLKDDPSLPKFSVLGNGATGFNSRSWKVNGVSIAAGNVVETPTSSAIEIDVKDVGKLNVEYAIADSSNMTDTVQKMFFVVVLPEWFEAY